MSRWGVLARLAGAAIPALAWYATRIEPRWLRVTRLTLALPDLPPAFEGYRIVQLSDLHLGVRSMGRYLRRVVAAANRERPDLAVITGDITTARRSGGLRDGAPVLAGLRAADGVWATLGNHDYYTRATKVKHALAWAGITLLRNAHSVVERDGQRLVVAGVDDMLWGIPDLPATLCGAPPDAPVILLAHEPDFALVASRDPRVRLQLSGHAHGGQVRVPGLPPLMLPTYGKVYPHGTYRVGDMALYVSSGVGTGRIVVRFNCRPEIAAITLRRAPDGQGAVWQRGDGV